MAICIDCELEMTTAASCVVEAVVIRDQQFPRRPWRPRRSWGPVRCGDCAVAPGGWHHLGCDMEDCPCCGRQLISCGCADDENGEGDVHPVLPGADPGATFGTPA